MNNEPKHQLEYAMYKTNGRNLSAVAQAFNISRDTAGRWRKAEQWDALCNEQDQAAATQQVKTYEQRRADVLEGLYDLTDTAVTTARDLLDDLIAHRAKEAQTQHLIADPRRRECEAASINAAFNALAKAVSSADTLYSIRVAQVAVTTPPQETNVDKIRAALAERMRARYYDENGKVREDALAADCQVEQPGCCAGCKS